MWDVEDRDGGARALNGGSLLSDQASSSLSGLRLPTYFHDLSYRNPSRHMARRSSCIITSAGLLSFERSRFPQNTSSSLSPYFSSPQCNPHLLNREFSSKPSPSSCFAPFQVRGQVLMVMSEVTIYTDLCVLNRTQMAPTARGASQYHASSRH